LLTLENPYDLEKYEDQISKELCEIYIDRDLGNEYPKGEEIALSLHKKGFEKLFLATGHDPRKFGHLQWLKCKGKESPWETKTR
jgi:hypothetical protein